MKIIGWILLVGGNILLGMYWGDYFPIYVNFLIGVCFGFLIQRFFKIL